MSLALSLALKADSLPQGCQGSLESVIRFGQTPPESSYFLNSVLLTLALPWTEMLSREPSFAEGKVIRDGKDSL